MRPGISTFVFLPDRLDTRLLDALHRAGAEAIEIVAARHHFDYTDHPTLRDLAAWFRDHNVLASLDQPRFAERQWSRHVAHSLNLLDPDKSRRITAMDETKRALEAAELIPFRSLTLYLGQQNDPWSPRALELSLTVIEHLKAFATPLGVQLLLENIDNDITTPEHLLEILRVGHLPTVGITLDLGHANLLSSRHRLADSLAHSPAQSRDTEDTTRSHNTFPSPSRSTRTPTPAPTVPSGAAAIDHALTLLAPRLVQLHLHDNDGTRDTHLPPGTLPTTGPEATGPEATGPEATGPEAIGIDWPTLAPRLANLPDTVLTILELANDPAATPEAITTRARTAFDHLRRLADQAADPQIQDPR